MTNQLMCRMKCQANNSASLKMALRFHRIPSHPKNTHIPISLAQGCVHGGNLCKTGSNFRATICPNFSATLLKVRSLD